MPQGHVHLHYHETPGNRIFDAIALMDSLHIVGYTHPLLLQRAIRVIKHSLVLAKDELCLTCDRGCGKNLDFKIEALREK